MPASIGDEADSITTVAFLGLGSSLGDRWRNLSDALHRLQQHGIPILAVSPVYESPHLGLAPADADRFPPHLNLAAKVETILSAEALLSAIQRVETAGGRERLERWGPRTIDIDILDYDGLEYASERLKLPHPGITLRAFAARPLIDVAPDFTLPDGTLLRDRLDKEPLRSQAIAKIDAAREPEPGVFNTDRDHVAYKRA